MDMDLGRLWEMVRDREPWCAAAHGVTKSQTWLSNWTATAIIFQPYKNGSQGPLENLAKDLSLHHLELDISLTCTRPRQRIRPIQSNTYQLHSVSMSPFSTLQPILDPSWSILNGNPYLPGPITLLNKQLMDFFFPLISLPHFVVWWKHHSTASWIYVSHAAVLRNPSETCFISVRSFLKFD